MDGEFPEQMKCPVCFEIPEKEIFQCQNGHTLCDVCAETITLCPQCRVDMRSIKIRSRALEDLLDMMKLDCKYKSKGCKEKVSRRTITSHSDNCNFGGERAPFCKYVGFKCDHHVISTKIYKSIQHLTQNHPCILESTSGVSMRLTDLKTDVGKEKSVWQPVILQAFDQHLAFITQSDGKCVSFACILLGTESIPKLSVEFCIKSTMENELALKWIIEPIPFTQAGNFLQFPPFQFPFELLNKSYLENGDLVVNILVFAENSGNKLAGNKLVWVKIYRAMQLSIQKPLYPNHDGRNNQSVLNRTKFENLCCDHCHKPCEPFMMGQLVYQCLECDDYKQCNSCTCRKKEHSFHHFSWIISAEQYTRHQEKTTRGTARIPYVECLQNVFDINSNRVPSHVVTTQQNLKCPGAECKRKTYLICLFCRGPHSVCWDHIKMVSPNHDTSHYFALAVTEEATKFVLNVLECDNLL